MSCQAPGYEGDMDEDSDEDSDEDEEHDLSTLDKIAAAYADNLINFCVALDAAYALGENEHHDRLEVDAAPASAELAWLEARRP